MQRFLSVAFLLLIGVTHPSSTLASRASITGLVRDAETAGLLPGSVVEVADCARATATDSTGRYLLGDLAPGSHEITVRRIGYAPRSFEALVPETGSLEINVALTPEPIRMAAQEVRAPVLVRGADGGETRAFPDRESSMTAVRNHPLSSEPDVLPALGGGEVVLDPESPNGMHVRGGSADQTAYRLDGIPLLSPYHAAGIASALNPDALSQVALESTAPALASSHALAGTVDATTRAPGAQLRTQGSVSTTQARVTLDGPLGAGGAGYVVSLRTGLQDALAPRDEASYIDNRTADGLAKIEAPAWGGRLSVLGYDNGNELGSAITANSEETTGGDPGRNAFAWHSRSLGAAWSRAFTRTAVYVRGYAVTGDAEASWAALVGRLDMTAVRRDRGFVAGAERISTWGTSAGEVRIESISTSYRVDSDSTAAPVLQMAARTPVATLSGWQSFAAAPDVDLTLSAALATTRGAWHASPGAEVRWRPRSAVTLTGRYARAHQFAQSLRNAESVVGTMFPVDLYIGAGAPRVPVARSDLGLIAAEYRPRTSLRCGIQAYARAADGLVLVALRESEPFATGQFEIGSGTARGIAADVALSAARYGIVLSYGYQEVRLASAETSYVPQHGARHLVEGGVTALVTPSLSARVGAMAALGRRTTTAAGGLEWEACNLLDFGCEFAGHPHYDGAALGAARLPLYTRVDLGVRKHWQLEIGARDVQLAVFGTVTNLLGRKNTMTYVRDGAGGDPVEIEMRPPSPLVVGLDWRF